MTRSSQLPNAVIIGAPKCGSTTLFHWLGLHPKVASIVNKEPHFLSDADHQSHPTFSRRPNIHADGIGAYPRLWPAASAGQRLIEATPSYIYHPTPLAVLGESGCTTQVIVVLRRPEDRVFSLYRHLRERSAVVPNDADFAQFMATADDNGFVGPFGAIANNAVRDSQFGRLLEPWMTAVGPDRLTVVSTDELHLDGPTILNNMWSRLGLDSLDISAVDLEIRNEAYTARFPGLQTVLHRARRDREIPDLPVLRLMRRMYREHGRVASTGPVDDGGDQLKALAQRFDDDLGNLRGLLDRDVFSPAKTSANSAVTA